MKWIFAILTICFPSLAMAHSYASNVNNQNWFWFQPPPVKQIAHTRHHYRHFVTVHHHYSSGSAVIHSNPVHQASGLETIQTAANIPITVAVAFADKIKGFIGDIVAAGYKPRSIGCYASGGHVRNSNHYHGGACDIDQTGRNRTAGFMYHVASIANKWGLRDGCTFHDCGHIDDGQNVGWRHAYASVRRHHRHYALRVHYSKAALNAYAEYQGVPVDPSIGEWVKTLSDQHGHNCCAIADGTRVESVDWEYDGHGYKVRLDQQWYEVPPEAVIDENNKVGYSIVWTYKGRGSNDPILIRCFLPGSQT